MHETSMFNETHYREWSIWFKSLYCLQASACLIPALYELPASSDLLKTLDQKLVLYRVTRETILSAICLVHPSSIKVFG